MSISRSLDTRKFPRVSKKNATQWDLTPQIKKKRWSLSYGARKALWPVVFSVNTTLDSAVKFCPVRIICWPPYTRQLSMSCLSTMGSSWADRWAVGERKRRRCDDGRHPLGTVPRFHGTRRTLPTSVTCCHCKRGTLTPGNQRLCKYYVLVNLPEVFGANFLLTTSFIFMTQETDACSPFRKERRIRIWFFFNKRISKSTFL